MASDEGSVSCGGESTSKASEATEAQIQSKRIASKRVRWLARAPQQVNDKWNEICKSKKRGKSKNKEKQLFTTKLFRDPDFKDVYWQQEVFSSHKKTEKSYRQVDASYQSHQGAGWQRRWQGGA